jgi:hypothetical protein
MPANDKVWMPRNGQLKHFDASFGRRKLPILLMGWHGRRQEHDLIESGLLATVLGQKEVSQMDGVKRPPK